MRTKIIIFSLIHFIFFSIAFSADRYEHQEFARIALDSVLTECKSDLHDFIKILFVRNNSLISESPLWNNKSFADLSVAFSGKDLSYARNHERRRTILQQLQSLPPELIEKTWNNLKSRGIVKSAEQKNKNVVANYLLHHHIALRFANQAAEDNVTGQEDLRFAFIYEAIALSYLVDAFSAAHLLIDYQIFSSLQPFNYKKAHNFFGTKGVFVINSTGDVWQTFGDNLMLWYEPTYRYTLNACKTSLRELLLIFYSAVDENKLPPVLASFKNSLAEPTSVINWLEARPGQDYYATLKMPALLSLPMPISASWSQKSEIVDQYGIHQRIYRPQLREPGFHDPDLDGIDPDFLLTQESIPEWLIFEEFKQNPNPESARKIIKENENFASVRYTQQRYYPPSMLGFVLNAAGGAYFNGDISPSYSIGAGFGLADDLLFFNNPSIDVRYIRALGDIDRDFVTSSLGAGIKLNLPDPVKFIKSFRLEYGPAWKKGRKFNIFDNNAAAGIEFSDLSLDFTYMGLTSRVMVQRIFAGSAINGIYFQVILH